MVLIAADTTAAVRRIRSVHLYRLIQKQNLTVSIMTGRRRNSKRASWDAVDSSEPGRAVETSKVRGKRAQSLSSSIRGLRRKRTESGEDEPTRLSGGDAVAEAQGEHVDGTISDTSDSELECSEWSLSITVGSGTGNDDMRAFLRNESPMCAVQMRNQLPRRQQAQ
jgi:hypothetical protein